MLSFFLSSSSSPSSWVIKYQRLSVKLILFILLWRLRGCRDFGSVGTCPDLALSITSMTRQLFAWNNPLVWRSIKERYWKDKVGGEKFTRSIIIELFRPRQHSLDCIISTDETIEGPDFEDSIGRWKGKIGRNAQHPKGFERTTSGLQLQLLRHRVALGHYITSKALSSSPFP